MISSRAATEAMIMGQTDFDIETIVTLALSRKPSSLSATPIATNRFTPTGGVTWPMARFTVAMMPKCTRAFLKSRHSYTISTK